MAAIKQQRGYDADEKQEVKSEYIWVVDEHVSKKRKSHFYDKVEQCQMKFPKGENIT